MYSKEVDDNQDDVEMTDQVPDLDTSKTSINKTLQKVMTMDPNYKGGNVIKVKTGGPGYKLVDKSKLWNRRPAIVYFIDLSILFLAIFNLLLWKGIDQLFENNPFQNVIVLNIIIIVSKSIVIIVGSIGMYQIYFNKTMYLHWYSSCRLVETFMISSIKFVYAIGLFNYKGKQEKEIHGEDKFTSFLMPMSLYYLMESLVFAALNIYLCNILWIGMSSKLKIEKMEE